MRVLNATRLPREQKTQKVNQMSKQNVSFDTGYLAAGPITSDIKCEYAIHAVDGRHSSRWIIPPRSPNIIAQKSNRTALWLISPCSRINVPISLLHAKSSLYMPRHTLTVSIAADRVPLS